MMVAINSVVPQLGSAFRVGFNLTAPNPNSLNNPDVLWIGPGPVEIPAYCFYTSASSTSNIFGLFRGVSIPDSVTSIGTSAFQGWSAAVSLVIEEGFDALTGSFSSGGRPFANWSNCEYIKLPSTITALGNYTMAGFSKEAVIEIHALTPPTITTATWTDLNPNSQFYVPDGSVTAYQTASTWSTYATRIHPLSDLD